MGGWLALIPGRVQAGILIAILFALALLGWRNRAVSEAVADIRRAQELERLRALQRREGIEDEINSLDDAALRKRAGKWLRAPTRRY